MMKKVLNVKIPASTSYASATTSTENNNNKQFFAARKFVQQRNENNKNDKKKKSNVSRLSPQPLRPLRNVFGKSTRDKNWKVTTNVSAANCARFSASAVNAKLSPIMPALGVKSEPSPRLLELSKPRLIQKQLPTEILKRMPSRILKAKATERTIELSQPRKASQTERPETKSLSKRALQSLVSRLNTLPSHRMPQQLFPIENKLMKTTHRK